MSDHFEDPTQKCLSKVFLSYETHIRGKSKSEFDIPYWDIIVITTADNDQKSVYQQQIQLKYDRVELPLEVPIHIVADPPGPKIGNGGSTLVAVEALAEIYGKLLFKKKILLIHAGGQSQRMPSASVLGKIFSPIPKGRPVYQMLDIKLAMFCPFIERMPPGIFVTCADDFILFDIGKDMKDAVFSQSGFTALAHPSSLKVGTGHGVYVLDNPREIDCSSTIQVCNCLEVLQKPSEQKMREKGAIFKTGAMPLTKGLEIHGNAVFTDSSFCFSHRVTKKFLKFMKDNGPLTCEIDAYGDFLQALGKKATSDYIHNVSNVTTVSDSLVDTRAEIFMLLKKTELSLLIMNQSKFVHIGTTKEYISHYCADTHFQFQMGLSKDVFNHWIVDETSLSGGSGEPRAKKQRQTLTELSDTVLGCVMHSVLPFTSNIASTAVMEYCHFDVPVNVGENCIVSNCKFSTQEGLACSPVDNKGGIQRSFQSSVDIPNNLFLHTIPVKDEELVKYVTVFFDIDDNLKKLAPVAGQLSFLGKQVEDFTAVAHVDPTVVTSGCSQIGSKVSLWHCPLFPLTCSMTESLSLALKCILAVKTDDLHSIYLTDYKLMSMATILQQKHVLEMLKQRSQVFEEIKRG